MCHSHKIPTLCISRCKWELHRTIASLMDIVLSITNPKSTIHLHKTIFTWLFARLTLLSDVNVNYAISTLSFIAGSRSNFHLNIETSTWLTKRVKRRKKGFLPRPSGVFAYKPTIGLLEREICQRAWF